MNKKKSNKKEVVSKKSYNALMRLSELSTAIALPYYISSIIELLFDITGTIVDFYAGEVLILKNMYTHKYEVLGERNMNNDIKRKIDSQIEKGIFEQVVTEGKLRVIPGNCNNHRKEISYRKDCAPGSFIIIPLGDQYKNIGIYIIYVKTFKEEIEKEASLLLSLLVNQFAVAIKNANLYQKMKNEIDAFSFLFNISKNVSSLEVLLETILLRTLKFTHTSIGLIALLNEKGDKLEIKYSRGLPNPKHKIIPVGKGINGLVAREGDFILLNECEKDKRLNESIEFGSLKINNLLTVPIKIRNKIQGVLTVCSEEKTAHFSKETMSLMVILANQASICIDNAILFQKVEELSVTDEYTQLYNMRFLRRLLDREMHRVERYGGEISLIFFDLDFFKNINDNYGHLIGSQILKEVAELVKDNIRNIDEVSRYGGDEFIVLLPHTGSEQATIVAERLRYLIANEIFLQDKGLQIKITASFGIASYPKHADESNKLIDQADIAMYEAKEKGKNRVIIRDMG